MKIINNSGGYSTIIKNNQNQSKVIKISKINGKPENELIYKKFIKREKYIYQYIINKGKGNLVFYSPTDNDRLKLFNFRSLGYITLYEYIKQNKNENEISILKKITFKKLLELHNIGVYHRDLHLKNIIIKNNDNTDIKFIDFGLSIIDNDLYQINDFLFHEIMVRFFYEKVSIDYMNFIDNHLQEIKNSNKFIILSPDSNELENLKRLLKFNDILTLQINFLTREDEKLVKQFFPKFTSIEEAKNSLQIVNNLFIKQESELNENEKSFVILFNNIFYGLHPFILPTESVFNTFIRLISNNNSNNNSNNMDIIIQNTKNNQVSNYLSTNRNEIIQYIELNVLDDVTSGVYSSIHRIPDIENIIVKRTPYQRFGESFIYENINNFTYIPKYYGEYKKNGINYLFLEYLDPRNGWENVDNFDLEIYKKVISALKGLHSVGIYHCNLHALNIMINNRTNEIKFIDFKKSINNTLINNSIIKVENGGLMFNYNNSFSFFQEKEYYKVCTDYLKLLQNNNTIIDNKDSLKEILKRNDFIELGFLFLSNSVSDNDIDNYKDIFMTGESNIIDIITTTISIQEKIQENLIQLLSNDLIELYFIEQFKLYFFGKLNPYTDKFEIY